MTTVGDTIDAATSMSCDALDALLAEIDTHPQMDLDGPFGELFSGPTEKLHRLGVFADRGSDGNVTLRPAGSPRSARQRLRADRTTRALRHAQQSFLRRMDDRYPNDVDYAQATAQFIDLLIRALDGDREARAEAAGYLGIDTDAVFAVISQLDRDVEHDRDAVHSSLATILSLADQVPENPQEPSDIPERHIHLADISTSVVPVHGPTATTTTSHNPGRVVVNAA